MHICRKKGIEKTQTMSAYKFRATFFINNLITFFPWFAQIAPSEKSCGQYNKNSVQFLFSGKINNVKNLPLAVNKVNCQLKT